MIAFIIPAFIIFYFKIYHTAFIKLRRLCFCLCLSKKLRKLLTNSDYFFEENEENFYRVYHTASSGQNFCNTNVDARSVRGS